MASWTRVRNVVSHVAPFLVGEMLSGKYQGKVGYFTWYFGNDQLVIEEPESGTTTCPINVRAVSLIDLLIDKSTQGRFVSDVTSAVIEAGNPFSDFTSEATRYYQMELAAS